MSAYTHAAAAPIVDPFTAAHCTLLIRATNRRALIGPDPAHHQED